MYKDVGPGDYITERGQINCSVVALLVRLPLTSIFLFDYLSEYFIGYSSSNRVLVAALLTGPESDLNRPIYGRMTVACFELSSNTERHWWNEITGSLNVDICAGN